MAKGGGDAQVRHLQRRRGRPRRVHGPRVLESDPHRVLEGMAIAAYAVGANQGYIYVRGEYPLAIQRLQTAISQADASSACSAAASSRRRFDFQHRHPHRRRRVRLRRGDGADRLDRGQARHAAPAPAVPGRGGPVGLPDADQQRRDVRQHRADHPQRRRVVRRHRHREEQGTKVFALAGKVDNTGLVEVPMGTTLREIVEEIGGGVPDGGTIKAVQTGGPSGGCIPAEHLDTPVDYESLPRLGSIMGSGGMIVMDETPTWSTSPGSSWNSAWTSRAASASPAAPAPCRCTAC